jgi:hypothetical protein
VRYPRTRAPLGDCWDCRLGAAQCSHWEMHWERCLATLWVQRLGDARSGTGRGTLGDELGFPSACPSSTVGMRLGMSWESCLASH